jgi:hypothetical protein
MLRAGVIVTVDCVPVCCTCPKLPRLPTNYFSAGLLTRANWISRSSSEINSAAHVDRAGVIVKLAFPAL